MVRNIGKCYVRSVTLYLYYELRCINVVLFTQISGILISSINVLSDLVVGVNTGEGGNLLGPFGLVHVNVEIVVASKAELLRVPTFTQL